MAQFSTRNLVGSQFQVIQNITSKCESLGALQREIRCKICLDGRGNFIQPCRCRGSSGYVHFKCIKQWIETKEQRKFDVYYDKISTTTCQICLYNMEFEATDNWRLSGKEMCYRIHRFPLFFAIHTVILVLLLVPTVFLIYALCKLLKSNDNDDNFKASLTIESTFLALTVSAFIKMLMVWISDYAVSTRINVTRIIEPSTLQPNPFAPSIP